MTRSNNRRTSLLLGGAGLAVAAMLALPAPAAADAFNASPTFVRGTGNVDRAVTGVDTVTITSATAVLDWTPSEDNFGNALTFLPNGNTAYFQDAPGQGGFAVLNRILPSTNGNVATFDGTVISRLQDATGNFSNGGTVAFYSPTGILVGSTAVFDVGQLLLTTLDPDLDSFESYAAGGTLLLTGAPGATAGITIASGAQIGAAGEGSYFVAAAPQVTMRGSAYVNGSTAYIAGEQVNLTYSNGLFDIEIPVGSSVTTPIDHSGSTGGPSSTGAGDNHLIYAVARAATDPMTMLFGGNLGFDPAVSAGVDNGDIILSAGYDVYGQDLFTGAVDPGAIEESIAFLGTSNLSSSVFAGATGNFSASSENGALDFLDGLTVHAARSVSLLATGGNDLSVTGDTALYSEGTIDFGGNATGGTIDLLADSGATLNLLGALTAYATPFTGGGVTTGGTVSLGADAGTVLVLGDVLLSARVDTSFAELVLDDSFGGTARLLAQNSGLIDLGGTLTLEADALAIGFIGTNATGGTSEIVAQTGGTITIAGNAQLSAFANGAGADGSFSVIDGGIGTGGTAQVMANGGTIAFGGNLDLLVQGYGGAGATVFQNGGGDLGGLGQGGQALVNAVNGSIGVTGTTFADASGFGGDGGSGGMAIGGGAQIFADGAGTIDLADVSLSAHGIGGTGLETGGSGGEAQGGGAFIRTEGTGDILLTAGADLQATATGGDGHSGGDATGGNAGIYAVFGTITVTTDALLSAQAFGGNANLGFGGNGGNATGGTAFVQADGSLSLAASLSIGGNAEAYADGYGGTGGDGDGSTIAAGNGGDGTGGTYQGAPGTGGAFALAGRDNATLAVAGNTRLYARGYGGAGGTGNTGQSGGNGGDGTGGTTKAGTFSGLGDGSLGAGQASFDVLILDASGFGGAGGAGAAGLGAGGIGKGGFAGIFAVGSLVDASSMTTDANGDGGDGSSGGDGLGGEAGFGVVAGTLNSASLAGNAIGTGGSATSGTGGDGIGGDVSIDLDSAMTVTGSINFVSDGLGGMSATGNGGLGQGGTSRITSTATGSLDVGGAVNLLADASGGAGVLGGNATGGSALMEVAGSSTVDLTDLLLSSDGIAGVGTTAGGNGTGGESRLIVTGGGFTASNSVFARSNGNGGTGTGSGTGGDGLGGQASMAINSGSASVPTLSLVASGLGGATQVANGSGGNGTGGTASLSGSAGGIASLANVALTASGVAGFDGGSLPAGSAFGGFVEVRAESAADLGIGLLDIAANGADTAGYFDVFANGGDIAVDQLNASAAGAVGGETSLIRATGGSIPVSGVANIFVAGDLDIVTASGGLIGGPTVAAPTASIFITAEGTVTIDGDNDGQISFGGSDLFISSRDLDILDGARVGAGFLGLSVIGNNAMTILGGTADGAGYTLTQDELARFEAGSASFSASFADMASDDILIRDMTIIGSLDDGTSSVYIDAGGIIRVEGVVAYVDAATTDQLAISAPRLEIVTPGGIGIVDADGNPTGTFNFYGNDFWMADAATIAELRTDVGFAGRDELLATVATGSDDPLGYLRAGDVSLVVGNSLLVRNTGTTAEPGGITVTGTLSISGGYIDEEGSGQTPSDQPLDVFAYGRLLNDNGSFVTGEEYFGLVEYNMEDTGNNFVTTYTDASQFNNCYINTGECAAVPPEGPGEREQVLEEIEQKAPAAAVTTTAPIISVPIEQSEQESNVEFGADFPSLVNSSVSGQTRSIDDPVTSGGDIALYGSSEDDPGEEEGGEGSDEQ